jgi:hypothetical protein
MANLSKLSFTRSLVIFVAQKVLLLTTLPNFVAIIKKVLLLLRQLCFVKPQSNVFYNVIKK